MIDMATPQYVQQVLESIRDQLDRNASTSLYEQIASRICDAIDAQLLYEGNPILPQRQLAKILKVSEVTVRRAMQSLATKGYIQSKVGSGTVVAPLSSRASEPKPVAANNLQIGIIFSGLSDGYPFLRPMLEGMRELLGHCTSIRMLDAPASDLTETDKLAISGLDGLVILSPINIPLVSYCQSQKLPYVLVYSDLSDDRSHCILVDYTLGLLQTISHLTSKNKTNITLITASDNRFSTGQLTDAYHTACTINNISPKNQNIIHAGYEEMDGYKATQSLLSSPTRPDAIIYASDFQAAGGLHAIREANLSIPQDIAIVGCGCVLRPMESASNLSSIDLNFKAVGKASIQTLHDLKNNKPDTNLRTVIRSSLKIGQTT